MTKLVGPLIFIIFIYSSGICKGQDSQKCPEIEWKNGSESAKIIMKSDFYYDVLDAWSPFGNDTGSDTYYLYCDWKKRYPKQEIENFVNDELASLGYPTFELDVDGRDVGKLQDIVSTMLNKYIDLNAINNDIIALAFSQLFLEGQIESKVKRWAEAAFSREVVYLDFWNGEKGQKEERMNRMNQMLSDLRKAKEINKD